MLFLVLNTSNRFCFLMIFSYICKGSPFLLFLVIMDVTSHLTLVLDFLLYCVYYITVVVVA